MADSTTDSQPRWSSRFAFYLGAAGAAVGLGSIWRLPYLVGTSGGSAFILAFAAACLLVATPLLAAEYAIGRRSRRSPGTAAGVVAQNQAWNTIGILGAVAAFLVFSYYTVIAGWLLAYTWKSATGMLTAAGPQGVAALWQEFMANPVSIEAWHIAFILMVGLISARGLNSGIEVANRIRAPSLLVLLCALTAYSLVTGDVERGIAFAFKPDFSQLTAEVMLAAIGQAFYATGVGYAMMIAYGAYVSHGTSLVRTALVVSGSILFVSLLATLMIFPLVFGYGMNPAQGPELVFEVLPRVFAEIPAGRLIGTLFFLLLVLAALIPSTALLEPAVTVVMERFSMSRSRAVWTMSVLAFLLGIGSVLSFNAWTNWHPLGFLPPYASMTYFEVMDYVSSNILAPIAALLTSVLIGWRVSPALIQSELAESTPLARSACLWLLRYFCPVGILAVLITGLT